MANTKKLIQAAAGAAGGEALNVEEVFSTYVYTSNGSGRSITNNINLSDEGGLVWSKIRAGTTGSHALIDTERGVLKTLNSNSTLAETTESGSVTAFNSDGYTIGTNGLVNFSSGYDYASWTFRKAPKFFDVVTYTGDGTAGRTISHNLGVKPGFIIFKRLDVAEFWITYHRSITATDFMYLDRTDAAASTSVYFNNTEPTDSVITLGSHRRVNASGSPMIAYVFAHNDGDGEFGPDGDADIIKCGSYTGNGSTNGPEIDLGFEPQWLLIKRTDSATPWVLIDNMRGLLVEGTGSSGRPSVQYLQPNDSAAELNNNYLAPKSTGFKLGDSASYVNASGGNYIYIAIRRGPMAVPEDADDVFAINTAGNPSTDPSFTSGFVTDMSFNKFTTLGTATYIQSRLQGLKWLLANTTDAETTASSRTWDYMDGWGNSQGTDTRNHSWMWKRAPNYFDVVAYTGTGSAGRTVSHNLGVAPEMMWVKVRSTTGSWRVYTQPTGNTGTLRLDSTSAFATGSTYWNNTDPSSTEFTVGTANGVNQNGQNFIAYLFASLDGVSKVFSVTKSSGSDASVNCGFSAGPRFVLLKRTDSTGDWYVWDSERGIVAGNDPYLLLNSTAAEVTSTDYIDPTSNGFTIVNGGLADGDYIGYSVA